jgi:capsular exopolysaccharide synthesis family protein
VETENTIEELQKSLAGLTSASQIENIEQKIGEETRKLDTLRTNYANFLTNSQEGATNILSVLEPANLPLSAVSSNRITIILLAGLVGFSLGAGAAYVLEYLDRSVKTAADVERIFNLPVIGFISEMSENGSNATYVTKNPNSILAENFRMLRSNIEFHSVTNQIKTIMLTSPSQGNGKTTIAANLALSISQLGQDVVLVDADLRRSAVHSALRMSRTPGLSDVIRNRADIENVIKPWRKNKNLKVITAGNKPPNITEVVGTKRLAAILSKLKEDHDLVIIDAPPLIISDTYSLASVADGVIIVMEPGQTTDEQARAIKGQLERVHARILGFVFNKVSEQKEHSYGDFQYRSLYSAKHYGEYSMSPNKDNEPVGASRSRKLVDFFEHGKIPEEMSSDVENALSTIKQPRGIFSRFRKAKREDES